MDGYIVYLREFERVYSPAELNVSVESLGPMDEPAANGCWDKGFSYCETPEVQLYQYGMPLWSAYSCQPSPSSFVDQRPRSRGYE